MIEYTRHIILKGTVIVNKTKIMADLPNMRLLFDEPLSNYTFTKTGGPADVPLLTDQVEIQKQIVTASEWESASYRVPHNITPQSVLKPEEIAYRKCILLQP